MNVQIELWYTDDLTAELGLGTERVPNHKLVHSFEVPDDDDENLCDVAFARFNRGSGREDPALTTKKLRSLSIGDIVNIIRYEPNFTTAYICASSGWRAVDTWVVG